MQSAQVRTRDIRKYRRFVFVLISLALIILIGLASLPFFAKRDLYISPVAKNSDDAKKIERLLIDAGISFSSISFLDYYYIVTLSDGGEARLQMPEHSSGGQVVLSLKKDLERQITSLQPILKQLTIDGKKFKRIDFRYDKPLVVYE